MFVKKNTQLILIFVWLGNITFMVNISKANFCITKSTPLPTAPPMQWGKYAYHHLSYNFMSIVANYGGTNLKFEHVLKRFLSGNLLLNLGIDWSLNFRINSLWSLYLQNETFESRRIIKNTFFFIFLSSITYN